VAEATNLSLTLRIEGSLTGGIRVHDEIVGLVVHDGVVDGGGLAAIARNGTDDGAGPPTELVRTTMFGEVLVLELTLASETIFAGGVTADRLQEGCTRFSYVPPGSTVPRPYRCQPDVALAERAKELGLTSPSDLPSAEAVVITNRLRPAFTSFHYGDPGYAQLAQSGPREIATGAEDGSEMGAFASLRQPQREANLRIRLEEYLPFGLRPALIYVT
jgi:hypothetical protein